MHESLLDSAQLLLGRLSGVAPVPLALALTFHLAKLGVRARAWQKIVCAAYPRDRYAYPQALAAFLAGTGVSAVVPARAGQLLRLRLARCRLESSTFPGLVSTLFAESVFDAVLTALVIGAAVALGLGGGLPGSVLITGVVARHVLIVALAASGACVALAWLAFRSRSKLRSLVADARRGLDVFARPLNYVRSVASWQALGWALRVGSVYWFLRAFHIHASLGAALVVIAVQLVAAAFPAPGGAGSQQALLVGALSASAAATVLGFGIGMQAATIVADLLLGSASLIAVTGSVRWRRLSLPADAGIGPLAPVAESGVASGV
jgi:Lysylphosphatidylglycerol synthase TM region